MTLARAELLLVLLGGVAHAQGAADELAAGIRHFQFAEFDRAERILTRAAAHTQDLRLLARIHFYLGLNAAADGRPAPARESLARALAFDPELTIDPSRFKTELVALFREVHAQLKGRLHVMVKSSVALVFLDGQRVGPTPVERALSIGAHLVEVRSGAGRVLEQRRIIVAPGKTIVIVVGQAASTVRPPASRPTERLAPSPRARLWTWVAAGVAVAAGAAALGTGLAARSDHDEFLALDRKLDLSAADQARLDALGGSGRRKVVATNALLGVAGAAVVGAAVLFFAEGRRRTEERPARARLDLRLAPDGVAVGGQF